MAKVIDLREWTDKFVESAKIDPVDGDYKPSIVVLSAIIDLSLKHIVLSQTSSFSVKHVLEQSGKIESLSDLNTKFIPALAKFIWEYPLQKSEGIDVLDIEYAVNGIAKVVLSDKTVAILYDGIQSDIMNDIDETSGRLAGLVGDRARNELCQFVIRHCIDNEDGIKALESMWDGYDKRYMHYKVAYGDDFDVTVVDHFRAMLANAWSDLKNSAKVEE